MIEENFVNVFWNAPLGHSKKNTCFSSPSHEKYDEGALFFYFLFFFAEV